jgi:protein-disulfide isomerase
MSKRNKAAERAARAAALKAERERQERMRRNLTIGAVVAGILIIVAGGFFIQSQRDSTGNDAPAPAGATGGFGVVVGDAGATHEVVIYEDFLCPVCGVLENEAGDALAAAIDDGRAQVEFRPVNFLGRFGDFSLDAANAFAVVLDAEGPEVAKEFHDLVYADQPAEDADEFPGSDWFVDKAVEAGASEEAVRPGIEKGAFEGWVDNATGAASEAGVTGTPTVMLDGEPVPGGTIGEIAANLEAGLQ